MLPSDQFSFAILANSVLPCGVAAEAKWLQYQNGSNTVGHCRTTVHLSHLKIPIIYKLSSRQFTTHNYFCEQYRSNRLVILIETKIVHYKCLQMKSAVAVNIWHRQLLDNCVMPKVTVLVQGYLANKRTPTPRGPPQDFMQRPTVGSWGVAFSYKRGTPVHTHHRLRAVPKHPQLCSLRL